MMCLHVRAISNGTYSSHCSITIRPLLLKMGRYYNTTMRHCWGMLVK